MDLECFADELSLVQYKGKPGVYFIYCYDGVIKIGQSGDLYERLISYQGVYWKNKILKIWQSNSPAFLEKQLHLFLGVELKQIRKGRYELFQLSETETVDLNDIVNKVDQRANEIMHQMECAINGNIAETDISQQIDTLLSNIESQSINGSASIQDTESAQESITPGHRIFCKFAGCRTRTTNVYCFRHHPNNEDYYKKMKQNKVLATQQQMEEYQSQIEEYRLYVLKLEAKIITLESQLEEFQGLQQEKLESVIQRQ